MLGAGCLWLEKRGIFETTPFARLCTHFEHSFRHSQKKEKGNIISGAIMGVSQWNVGMSTQFHRNFGTFIVVVLMSTEGGTDRRAEL